MKNIIFINFFLLLCIPLKKDDCKERYSIEVWDYDYSMAYTIFYKIDNDSVTVKYISGIRNGKDSVLMQRTIRANECKMVWNFFQSHDINRFKDKYSNPMVDDGDQKRVVFNVKGKSKAVEIANFYQRDMGELFGVINKIVDKGLQIKYKRPS